MPRSSDTPRGPHHPALGVATLLESHYHHYLDYARLLLPPDQVHPAVCAAAAQAAARWQNVLAAPDATAALWRLFRAALVARACPQALAPVAHLTAGQQDLVLMRHALGWSDATITTVTGTDRCAIEAAARSFARTATATDPSSKP
ncbi:hypothetical protein ACFXPX_04825 [Kitasatospora sp. NPDC059146]|uniref:hypothetical protein n=1 Tax=unclassified Kitasatospora TaxID=2633591 RepID=UPI00369699F1